jgi:hypothetical protein
MNTGTDVQIKRVGSSGQISLGKRYAGQLFREEEREDGSIVLVPVAVLPTSHWSIRDGAKIKRALSWAAENPPKESDLDELTARAASTTGKRRGR